MWKNKKFLGYFKGSYEKDRDGERVFVLRKSKSNSDIARKITFESFQMAKKLGWIKVK